MLIEWTLYLQTVFHNVKGRFSLSLSLSLGALKGGLFHGIVSNLRLYRVEW